MRAVFTAFAFLTRLPVRPAPPSDADLGRSVTFFPLVGLVLGLLLTAVAFAAAGRLPPGVTAVLLVALLAAATGGLHLDGLADVFDGVGGGQGDRARTLEIMRDSRIGAHGAAALVLLLVAKVLALAYLLERRDLSAVLAFAAIARWAAAPVIALVPYARPDGLGRAFSDQAGAWQVAGATLIAAPVALASGGRLLVPSAAALVTVVLLALWLKRRLGGMTGDAYGAAIEMAEVAFLVAASAGR